MSLFDRIKQKKWKDIDHTCIACGKEVKKESWVFSYWGHPKPQRNPCHKECKKEHIENESYECQKLDADCNDCKYFIRGEMLRKGAFEGHCTREDKPVKAYPNFNTGHKCFKHRRD